MQKVRTTPMRCPTCDSVITHNTPVCSHCETPLDPSGARLDPTDEDVHLRSDEEIIDLSDEGSNRIAASAPPTEKTNNPLSGRISHPEPDSRLWGGFISRACAFALDWAIILLLGFVMFVMSHIGYKVGLSAHGRSITMENSSGLYFILTWASVALSAAYFVIFHSLDGRTIGKWIFGLRVVGADNGDVSIRQALLRWLAAVGFAPILLGFLWVIWSREKRSWHDIIAQTWVIRE
jgi:uncharacterized RDD family membrane protein YckC